ncbi:MAG: ATP-dependent helicase DeaD [Eubacteriales bacterium]|nr:ATP-dependent helicase DeaD [Eubacteriales bacterium]
MRETVRELKNVTGFSALGLSKAVLKAISDLGWEEPTPIQREAIPLLLAGKDVIGQAQTGTGKTGAFGIPIVEKINPRQRGVQALVLTPTRELALQVAEEIARLGRYRETKVLPVYGGQSIERQVAGLKKGVQVVIGTPGRIIDHLDRGTLKLDGLQILVLDEADEMLDMGFIDDIETIIHHTPSSRQTLLFSATMPPEIRHLARKYLREPEFVTVSRDELTVPSIQQVYFEVKEKWKMEALCRIIDSNPGMTAIIFCRTKKGADELAAALKGRGYSAEGLHGDMTQYQRNKVMRQFRTGQVELLVATDVAARGIDVEHVTHVINYDIPQDPEVYVHRIGRTGRAGRQGVAMTFISPGEFRQLRLIEKTINMKIPRGQLPSLEELTERQKEELLEQLRRVLAKGELDYFRTLIAPLLAEFDAADVAAAAVKLQFEEELPEEEETDFGDTGARPGMVRMFMTLGREDGIGPREIVQLVAEECDIPREEVGKINVFDRFSFVEIPLQYGERFLSCFHHYVYNGRRINAAPAMPRR